MRLYLYYKFFTSRNNTPYKVELSPISSKADPIRDPRTLKPHDCIFRPETKDEKGIFGYIVNIFENDEDEDGYEDNNPIFAHILQLIPSQQTFLSVSGDPNEFFLTKECCDVPITNQMKIIPIEYLKPQT